MIRIIEAVIISSLCMIAGGLVTYLFTKVKKLVVKEAAVEKGLKALLSDRIVQMHHYYVEKGHISTHSLHSADRLYKEYKNLGGNGAIEKIVREIMNLPIVNVKEISARKFPYDERNE